MKFTHRLLATLAVLSGLLAGCHTMDPYRPGAGPTAVERALDPRPDLPGRPIAEGDDLWRLAQELQNAFPTPHPVQVRWSPLQDPYLGVTHPSCLVVVNTDTDLVPVFHDLPEGVAADELVIEVRDDLPLPWMARDVLLHEYAHALAWDAVESPHGAVWSAYFGALYRATRGERP